MKGKRKEGEEKGGGRERRGKKEEGEERGRGRERRGKRWGKRGGE